VKLSHGGKVINTVLRAKTDTLIKTRELSEKRLDNTAKKQRRNEGGETHFAINASAPCF
jgi:hypothetical protein